MFSVNIRRLSIPIALWMLWIMMPLATPADDAPATAGNDQPTSVSLQKITSDPTDKPAETPAIPRKHAVTPEIRPGYTSRSIMAVGRIKSIDSATSTVVVAIDREKSSLPHILMLQAAKAGIEGEVLQRELPPERAFRLSSRTLYFDARPDPTKTPVLAESGKIMTDPSLIKFSELAPGQWVSVLYRMRMDTAKPPIVFNISQVDPEKNQFNVDFNPLGGRRQFTRKAIGPDRAAPAAPVKKEPSAGKDTVKDTTAP